MKNLISQFKTWTYKRAAARQLNALPDRMLRDIGLERGMIDSAVAGFAAAQPVGSYNRYAVSVAPGVPLVTMRALSMS